MDYKYAVCRNPGYCGDHSLILSVHTTLELARKVARKQDYTDSSGKVCRPLGIIENDGSLRKGDSVSVGGASGPKARWVE